MMRKVWTASLALALAACGDDDRSVETDMFVPTDSEMVEPDMPEPDPCGDGVVGMGEICDPGIPDGMEGACPSTCDDGDLCTSDTIEGSGCNAVCVNDAITEASTGDGCCPEGVLPIDDRDCTGDCGNGVVDDGETCDLAVPTGQPGACPTETACDDGLACTADTLENGGTCTAACVSTDITITDDGTDGCCPEGASVAEDSNCSATCGDGVQDVGETCDSAIAAGEVGACPTSCDDADLCTTNRLVSAGTCNAECSFPEVAPADGDGCCPSGANARTDDDCTAVCGNNVVEPGETCDDGNMTAGDGCDASCISEVPLPTAMRITSLELRDPHVLLPGCSADGTGTANSIFQDAVDMYSLNTVGVFRPLDTAAPTTPMDVFPQASCSASTPIDQCAAAGPIRPTTANNQSSGVCYTADASTLSYPTTPPNEPSGSCFVTTPTTVSITFNGSPLVLQNATVAGEYGSGVVTNGVLAGFLSYSTAMSVVVSFGAGSFMLYDLLPGGGCPGDAADPFMAGGADAGWWFYIDFEAEEVEWTE